MRRALRILAAQPLPAATPCATPHAPQMWYTRDAQSDNYTCIVANGYGEIVMRLWGPASFFTPDRLTYLAAICEIDFGVQPNYAAEGAPIPFLVKR